MTTDNFRCEEIDRNYTAFTTLLPDLLQTSAGKWALLRDRSLVAVFDSARDAQLAGEKSYPDRIFSVQEVRGRAVDRGWFSHVVFERTVTILTLVYFSTSP